MKKPLTDRAHGYVDYATVLYLAAAPTIFGLYGTPAAVFYILAIAHFSLTLATAFPLGLVRALRFSVHGTVEAIVAFALAAMPWLAGYSGSSVARNVTVATAIGIGIVALLTDYRHVHKPVYERALDERNEGVFMRSPMTASDFSTASFPPVETPVSSQASTRRTTPKARDKMPLT